DSQSSALLSLSERPRRVPLPGGGGRKSNRFSGGVYVGKTLCAERASQDPLGAEAQAQRIPFGGKGASLFRQYQKYRLFRQQPVFFVEVATFSFQISPGRRPRG